MIVDTKEAVCLIKILSMLSNKKGKYNNMFRTTKVSHTTLQRVLKEAVAKKIIEKYDIGHMNVDYKITEKGKRLLALLLEVERLCVN